jgi:hypothetical protein
MEFLKMFNGSKKSLMANGDRYQDSSWLAASSKRMGPFQLSHRFSCQGAFVTLVHSRKTMFDGGRDA